MNPATLFHLAAAMAVLNGLGILVVCLVAHRRATVAIRLRNCARSPETAR